MVNFSEQQGGGIKQVLDWVKDPCGPQVFRFFGFAGTGKTFCATHIASEIGGNVLFAAFTVAPHAGAWIETFMPLRLLITPLVAPHAGAWIETVRMWRSED